MKKIITLIKSNNWHCIIFAMVMTYIIFPTFFITGTYPLSPQNYLWSSLDPSWALALKYAVNQNLIWGKDVAFTYGPLSYLVIRDGWGSNKWSFILFDSFYYFNFFLIFYIRYKNASNKMGVVLICLLLVAIMPTYPHGGAALVMLLFLAFWIYRNISNPSYINYIFQIIILVLLFFIKFNTGLISFFLFYSSIFYFVLFKKESYLRAVIFSIVPLLLIIFFSDKLNVSLKEYIISGYNIVSGFNDIMYINESAPYLFFLAIAFILLSLFFLVIQYFPYNKDSFFENSFKIGVLCVCMFIIFKQAFVRADMGHVVEFFRFILLLLLCVEDFTSYKLKKMQSVFLFFLILIIAYVGFREKDITIGNMVNKLNKTAYFNRFVNFEEESKSRLIPNKNSLPTNVLNKIGKNTIDIFPWNIHLLLENNLNYSPRPVLQSYSCYNKFLQDLNFEHYNSVKAPKFVLLDYETIDMRYAFFDEVKSNIVLTKCYKVSDTLLHNQRRMLLLERKTDVRPLKLIKISEYVKMINDPIIPKKDIYYEIEIYSNFRGKVRSIFRHTPEVSFKIQTDSVMYTGRTSPSMLKAGIFSQFYIKTIDDFKRLFNNDDSHKENSISAYYIKPLHADYYEDKIIITEYKITQ